MESVPCSDTTHRRCGPSKDATRSVGFAGARIDAFCIASSRPAERLVATTAADTDNQVQRSLRPDRDHRADAKGHAVRLLRLIVPVLAALAVLLLVPESALANRAYTVQVKGIEYSATTTVGKFAGTATGRLPGTWQARVVHDPIDAARTAPITDGSFQLYSHTKITGDFVDGAVTRLNTPTTCADERFDVRGNLALDGGGTGQFTVLLTHLVTPVEARCVTYAATVGGTLTLAPTALDGA
jgi:hypothetical protein